MLELYFIELEQVQNKINLLRNNISTHSGTSFFILVSAKTKHVPEPAAYRNKFGKERDIINT